MKIEQLQKKIKDFEKSLKEQVNEFQSEIGLQAKIIIWEKLIDKKIDDKFSPMDVEIKVML